MNVSNFLHQTGCSSHQSQKLASSEPWNTTGNQPRSLTYEVWTKTAWCKLVSKSTGLEQCGHRTRVKIQKAFDQVGLPRNSQMEAAAARLDQISTQL